MVDRRDACSSSCSLSRRMLLPEIGSAVSTGMKLGGMVTASLKAARTSGLVIPDDQSPWEGVNKRT
jgi:hypothetical protein